jgi:hypothetical protein
MQAGVDDVHAGITQSAGDDFDATIVAIEADLGEQDADWGAHAQVLLGDGRVARAAPGRSL